MKKTDKKDGINVDIRSKEVAYITIKTLAGKWTIYVDNSTGEHVIRELGRMRYEYTVTKEGGEAEIMKAMSWKKLFKSLLLKYPEFSGWCTYINKKGHVQVRNFLKGKETKKL